MDKVDAVVIGAGVVGLAVARELALQGRETLILETAERFGSGASSRNSEVIHAGIYYPRGSLKARLCAQGRERLYEFCRKRGVGHRRCGKLIVATSPAELAALSRLAANARENHVELAELDAPRARELEPHLTCVAALHSPLTGIIDAQGLMLALLGEAETHGATLVCRSTLTRAVIDSEGALLGINGCEPALRTRALINCAGIQAPAVAGLIEGLPAHTIPTAHFAKGNYFALSGPAPFRRLIYPLPEGGGLGIHLTLDLAGQARFGPDLEWLDAPDWRVSETRAGSFYTSIRRYWPGLPEGALRPAYAGVRAKISDAAHTDFRIDDAATHGIEGLVNLYGIDSPGLTASLALASEIAARV